MLTLYTYFRSSAAYRVRIALGLKGLPYDSHAVHLVKDGGQQHTSAYRALNPQALVPSLQTATASTDGSATLTQSLAIWNTWKKPTPRPPPCCLPTWWAAPGCGPWPRWWPAKSTR